MGNYGELFQLGNGSIWQVMYAYEYLYEYNPSVIICPSINKLTIGDVQIDIVPLSQSNGQRGGTVIESKIDGVFERGLYIRVDTRSLASHIPRKTRRRPDDPESPWQISP